MAVRDDLSTDAVRYLSEAQGLFLADVAAGARQEQPTGGDAWQDLIYRAGQRRGVSSRDAFAAVYAAFLGRPNGPRAGWLLASLDGDFVVERLEAAAGAVGRAMPGAVGASEGGAA